MIVSVIIPVYKVEEYIRRCVINEANKKIKNSKVICLNNKERDCFLKALNNKC